MKLAVVSQPYDRIFPPAQNSIGLIAYHTALNLAPGNEVTIYRKDYREDVLPDGLPVSVENVSVNRDRALQRLIRGFPRLAGRLGIDGKIDDHKQYRRKVARRIARNRPDIVHVMNYWNWCRELRSPGSSHRLVLEMHCEWLSQRDREQVARQLEVVDAVVAVSDHVANTFLTAFPDFPDFVATVGNGVDVTHFKPRTAESKRPAGSRRRILFVGRISPEKGIHTLLEAFGELARRIGDVDLEIAGPHAALSRDFLTSLSSDRPVQELLRFYDRTGACTYPADLEALLDRYHLRDRVRFLGPLTQKDLGLVYQSSDVVVIPSLSESFGISVVEGMASGIPVVGTRVGGMCETIVSGTTGYLVEADAPDQLASALASIMADPVRARRMGIEGRRRAVQYFSWQARADRLNDLFGRLVGGQPAVRRLGCSFAPEAIARVQSG